MSKQTSDYLSSRSYGGFVIFSPSVFCRMMSPPDNDDDVGFSEWLPYRDKTSDRQTRCSPVQRRHSRHRRRRPWQYPVWRRNQYVNNTSPSDVITLIEAITWSWRYFVVFVVIVVDAKVKPASEPEVQPPLQHQHQHFALTVGPLVSLSLLRCK